MDIHSSSFRTFTCMGGGANGSARYWQLWWPFGSVMWIVRKPIKSAVKGGSDD